MVVVGIPLFIRNAQIRHLDLVDAGHRHQELDETPDAAIDYRGTYSSRNSGFALSPPSAPPFDSSTPAYLVSTMGLPQRDVYGAKDRFPTISAGLRCVRPPNVYDLVWSLSSEVITCGCTVMRVLRAAVQHTQTTPYQKLPMKHELVLVLCRNNTRQVLSHKGCTDNHIINIILHEQYAVGEYHQHSGQLAATLANGCPRRHTSGTARTPYYERALFHHAMA